MESVRDPADLYLSLKYPPTVFICDSPCGLVRHLEVRVPDLCEEYWSNNSGCFEEPQFGKNPTKVPLIDQLKWCVINIIFSH